MADPNHDGRDHSGSFAAAGPPRCRVLLLEDDAVTRRCMTRLMQSWGFEAQAYATAEDLLNEYRGETAEQGVVLDIRLPGMDGLDAGGELRRRGCRAPILLISGEFITPGQERRIRDLGNAELMRKPCVPSLLCGWLHRVTATERRDEPAANVTGQDGELGVRVRRPKPGAWVNRAS